jgi:hypothetical protein
MRDGTICGYSIRRRLTSSPNRDAIEGKERRGEPSRLRKNYCGTPGRMLKKSVQQGRSERRGEAYASVR